MGMRFGTWNIKSLCKADSLKTVAAALAKCNLDLMAVQKVRSDKGGREPVDGNGNANHHLGTVFFHT